jgi:hypothetical protein
MLSAPSMASPFEAYPGAKAKRKARTAPTRGALSWTDSPEASGLDRFFSSPNEETRTPVASLPNEAVADYLGFPAAAMDGLASARRRATADWDNWYIGGWYMCRVISRLAQRAAAVRARFEEALARDAFCRFGAQRQSDCLPSQRVVTRASAVEALGGRLRWAETTGIDPFWSALLSLSLAGRNRTAAPLGVTRGAVAELDDFQCRDSFLYLHSLLLCDSAEASPVGKTPAPIRLGCGGAKEEERSRAVSTFGLAESVLRALGRQAAMCVLAVPPPARQSILHRELFFTQLLPPLWDTAVATAAAVGARVLEGREVVVELLDPHGSHSGPPLLADCTVAVPWVCAPPQIGGTQGGGRERLKRLRWRRDLSPESLGQLRHPFLAKITYLVCDDAGVAILFEPLTRDDHSILSWDAEDVPTSVAAPVTRMRMYEFALLVLHLHQLQLFLGLAAFGSQVKATGSTLAVELTAGLTCSHSKEELEEGRRQDCLVFARLLACNCVESEELNEAIWWARSGDLASALSSSYFQKAQVRPDLGPTGGSDVEFHTGGSCFACRASVGQLPRCGACQTAHLCGTCLSLGVKSFHSSSAMERKQLLCCRVCSIPIALYELACAYGREVFALVEETFRRQAFDACLIEESIARRKKRKRKLCLSAPERMDAKRRELIARTLTLCCPSCDAPYASSDACASLRCARCASSFCALCHAEFESAGACNAHVPCCAATLGVEAAHGVFVAESRLVRLQRSLKLRSLEELIDRPEFQDRAGWEAIEGARSEISCSFA